MITVRRAEERDIDSLVELLRLLFAIEKDFTFNEPLQRRGLERMVQNDRGCVLVAEAEGRVIGMCSGQLTISTAEGGPALLVEDVVVAVPWRSRGTGRRLLEELENWAGGQKISRLQLLADRKNFHALGFYQNLGWETTQLICLRKRITLS